MPALHSPQAITIYPIRWVEELLISLALDPNTTTFQHDYMTVRWAVRIVPSVSPRKLQRAFDRLVARHEPLRMRFVETKDGWKSEILAKHPVGLIIEDLGPASIEDQQVIVAERVRRPLTALSQALFEMRMLRFGQSGDVIMLRANHAIIDGYSVVLLIEEFLKLVLNLSVGATPISHGQFVAFKQKQARDQPAESTQFWTQMLLPPAQELNIGRALKGLGRMTGSAVQKPLCYDNVLGVDDSNRVHALSHAKGASPFAVLHTVFSDTLCAMAGQDTVLVSSIFGRSDAAFASYIGPSIEVAPLRYVRNDQGILAAIGDTARNIASVHQYLPTEDLHADGNILQTLEAAGVAFDRFWVTFPQPTGRLKSSPFGKLFENVLQEPLSLGPVSVEQVIVPSLCPTDAEMDFTIKPTENGYTAAILADAAAYDLEYLGAIADGIRRRLDQA